MQSEQTMMLVAPLPCAPLPNRSSGGQAAPVSIMAPPPPVVMTASAAAGVPLATTSSFENENQCPMLAAFLAASKRQLDEQRTITPPSASSSPTRNNSNNTSRVSFREQLCMEVAVPSLACLAEDHRRSLWYAPADIDNMRTEARDLCRWLRINPQAAAAAYRLAMKERSGQGEDEDDDNNNDNVDEGEQWRGLELRISLERQCRKQLTVQGVVRAQQRSNDPSFIAFIAQRCSALPREVALAQAQRDFCSVYHPSLTKLLPSGCELTATATQQSSVFAGGMPQTDDELQERKRQLRQQQLQELQQQVQLGLQAFTSSAGDLATASTCTSGATSGIVVGQEFAMMKPPASPLSTCSAAGDLALATGQEYKTLAPLPFPSPQLKQEHPPEPIRFPFMDHAFDIQSRWTSLPGMMECTGLQPQLQSHQHQHMHAHYSSSSADAGMATYATSIEDGCDALLQWQEAHLNDLTLGDEDSTLMMRDQFDPFGVGLDGDDNNGFGDGCMLPPPPPPPMPIPQQHYQRAVSFQSYLQEHRSSPSGVCCNKRQHCEQMPPPAPVPSRIVRRRTSLESTPETLAMAEAWNNSSSHGGFDWSVMEEDSLANPMTTNQMFG